MRKSDQQALAADLDAIIVATINRLQNPKEALAVDYRYRIELKKVLKRERIYSPIPDEAVAYISGICRNAEYNEATNSVSFSINLFTVMFNTTQANLFNEKMESFGKKTL